MSIEYNYVRFPASLENVTDLNYKVLYILDTLGMDAVACESPRPPRRARYPEPAPLPRLPAERPVHRWRGSIQTSSRLRLHDCSTSALPCPTKPGHTRRAPCDATAAPGPLLSTPPRPPQVVVPRPALQQKSAAEQMWCAWRPASPAARRFAHAPAWTWTCAVLS